MTVGLVSLLQTGKSSLLSHQSGISTASQNLANVNTEGFSKRDALFQADGRYNGLSNVDVRRRRAMFVGVNILAQESRKAGAEAKMTALASLDRVYADGDGSLGDRLDKFFDTIRTLETSPTDGDLRTNMVAQAQALVLRRADVRRGDGRRGPVQAGHRHLRRQGSLRCLRRAQHAHRVQAVR